MPFFFGERGSVTPGFSLPFCGGDGGVNIGIDPRAAGIVARGGEPGGERSGGLQDDLFGDCDEDLCNNEQVDEVKDNGIIILSSTFTCRNGGCADE